MRIGLAHVIGATLALTSTSLLSTAVSATAATSATGDFLLSTGTITVNGSPLAGADIEVVAEPSTKALTAAGSSGLDLLPLGSGTSSADGTFRVTGSIAGIPTRYLGTQQQADLDVVVSSGDRNAEWSYTLFPSNSQVVGVKVAAPSDANISSQGQLDDGRETADTNFDLGTNKTWDADDSPTVMQPSFAKESASVRLQAGPNVSKHEVFNSRLAKLTSYSKKYLAANVQSRRAILSVTPSDDPDGGDPCTSTWSSDYHYQVHQGFVKVYSSEGIPVTLTEGTANSTTHTLGLVQVAAGGSLSESGTTSLTQNKKSVATDVANAVAYNRVNYRLRLHNCGDDVWLPYSFYDLLTDWDYSGINNFKYCAPKAKGQTWDTGTEKNQSWAGGVQFPGLSVESQSGYAQSVDLLYNFTRAGEICGSTAAGPDTSKQVSAD